MENFSQSFVGHGGGGTGKDRNMASAEKLVLDICDPQLRDNALFELSKEIVSIYPYLSPPKDLSPCTSNRVCNALAVLQCVASHPETRTLFLDAHIPIYVCPFLNTTNKEKPFEYLRLTSLGVIAALVKVDDTDVIRFLLHTEIIRLCLRTMENGSELSKTVATFIVFKILMDDVGLQYICTNSDRFFAVTNSLRTLVESLVEEPSTRLLKHIIRCYLRLTDDQRSCVALQGTLPIMLKDRTFERCLQNDQSIRQLLRHLLINVYGEIRVVRLHQ